MHEPDLFPEETAKARMEREAKEQPQRGKYHDRRGQFTDRRTAEIAAFQREINLLKKENAILKTNFNYYKRVNVRLSEEVKEEQQKSEMLTKLIERAGIGSNAQQGDHFDYSAMCVKKDISC